MSGTSADPGKKTSFWQAVGAALAALAKKSGSSMHHSPLPEIREAVRDWRRH